MPQFFFDTTDGFRRDDNEGAELPDLDIACREALRRLARVLEEGASEILRAQQFSLTVRDEEGLHLLRLDLTATVAPIARPLIEARLGRQDPDNPPR